MRYLSLVAAAGLISLISANVMAQTEATGKWKSTNDSPGSIETKPPAMEVAKGSKSFAEGDAKAVLGKGGPTGAFLWAHVHAVHPDRMGSSTYKAAVLVRDEGNYYYIASPRLESKVEGVLDKPDRHRHSFGQFRLPPGDDADALKDAIEGGVKLVVEVNGTRENEGFFGDIPDQAKKIIGEYLEGSIDVKEMLGKLNDGKSPRKS